MKIKILLFATLLISLFGKAQTNQEKIKLLTELANNSDIIFEGEVIKQGEAFKSAQNVIYTPYEVKINHIVYGSNISSTIQLVLIGGIVGDESMESNHGYQNLPRVNTLFFIKSVKENNKILTNSNGNYYEINSLTTYGKNNSISLSLSPNDSYTNVDELFNDLSKIKSIVVPQKKSIKENVVQKLNDNLIQIPTISYQERSDNFNNRIQRYLTLQNSANKTTQVLASDVTLQIANGVITGTSPKYFEFDVNIKSNNSSSFLENMPIWITYNTAVFGTSVVATSSVIVTNGTSFNNINYSPANSYITDNSSNTFAFVVGTDFALSNPTRVNITTTYKQLAHVKMLITGCGNVTVDLSNASTAINSAYYTPTINGSFSTALNYTALNYNGSLTNSIPCLPTIIDFTSPVHGGVDILTISGYGFGNARGSGQVKFRNADSLNFPYIQKLNYPDYISWTDTEIKIKMPSRVDSLPGTKRNTPGTGDFIVKTNNGDSIVSNLNLGLSKFKVYYSLYTRTINSNTIKRIVNISAKNNLGGYTIRLDTSISNNPDRLKCVKKAIKDWRCLTTVNLVIGSDTSISTFPSTDNICYMSFANFNNGLAGETFSNAGLCTSTIPNILYIRDFDVRFKASLPWFYDTTGTALQANQYDFYEAVTHEIGHAIGLEHIIDTNSVMYYKTKYTYSGQILGANRRTLVPYAPEVDGGLFQISNSIATLNLQCTPLVDMIPVSNGSCTHSTIGVQELLGSNFNMIVYPNPSTDGDINISFDVIENTKPKIEIYNLLGEKLLEKNVTNDGGNHFITKLNLNDFSNGVYILNVVVNKNKASYKIVKQ